MSDSPSMDAERRAAQAAEERAILEALACLETGDPTSLESLSEDARAYAETLAALPYALDPVAPSPLTRQRLLARAGEGSPEGRDPVPAGAAIPVWMKALAAGLMAAVLGLGFATLRLSESVESQRQEIASLTHTMLVGHHEAEAQEVDYLDLPADPRLAQIRIEGSRLYPIASPENAGYAGVEARGAVFVCAKHLRWYLRLTGLEPAPGDRAYRLWFLTGDGPVPASVLEVRPGEALEATADRMPPDTRGILISLEEGPFSESMPEQEQVVAVSRKVLEV